MKINIVKGEMITTLYRPVNQAELDLIQNSNWEKFPARLPEQPIFYPVTNEAYAVQITTEWNVPAYGVGYVVEFDLPTKWLAKYNVENVGGEIHNEVLDSCRRVSRNECTDRRNLTKTFH